MAEGKIRGEAAVRAALVDAAAELFATRGINTVSVREIAEKAGVNHGLVHHYFASKDGLLSAVLVELSRRAVDEFDADFVLYAAGGTAEQQGRIVAALILEGRDLKTLQTEFPTIAALVARLEKEGRPDARERAAHAAAFILGWKLYEPFIATAAQLTITDVNRKSILDRGLSRLLD